MAHTPGKLRRTPLALATALVLVAGTLALGLNVASAAPAVRKYSASLINPPSCIEVNTRATFTATFKNDMLSNQKLGSAKIDSDDNPSFLGVADIAITDKPSGKTWTAVPDHSNPDGVLLKATSTSSALSPGESVTVTFSAVAPPTQGTKTWKTSAWQSIYYLTSFSKTMPYPTVTVANTCVGEPANIAFVSGPSDTTAGGQMANVTVQVTDASAQNVPGVSVSLASDGLATSPSETTDDDGIATFSGASLTVKNLAGPYTMTASGGGLDPTPAVPFNITAGAPIVTFSTQPTDTLKDTAINGPPTVTAADTHGNPVSGLPITLSVSPDSFASGVLTGDVTVITNGSGVAPFPNVKIALSSSGYMLRTDVGGVDSAAFNITSTPPDGCSGANCTVEFGDTGSTVTAPNGTVLIIENNVVVDCGGAITNPIVGTVTVNPPSGPNIDVVFSDPAGSGYQPIPTNSDDKLQYPVCKGGSVAYDPEGDGELLRYCADSAVPCVKSQDLDLGTLALETVITITDADPPVRH